ncbi:MAG: ATP citrate lyase citrate-binding domain-containing protein [Elusimicrobiaceae bacterium]|nr:ATP citrate lyase citrate-binding domain-containing protein [Elusimicrobiaceae bacterium]
MAQRGIREYDGKRVLFQWLSKDFPQLKGRDGKLVLITPESREKDVLKQNPWLKKEKLVAKPDQLFGKRGKHGLLCINADWKKAWGWVSDRMNKSAKVGETTGELTHFLVEPFTPHAEDDEFYIAMRTFRDEDVIYFSTKGGIYVEENWDKVIEIKVPTLAAVEDVKLNLPALGKRQEQVEKFIRSLFGFYRAAGFTYLEINPFAFNGDDIIPLDFVARVDDTSMFETGKLWGELEFPPAFGMRKTPEEQFISELDEKSGSSLKLTVLNSEGRIWAMVAGGGASVIYADTVGDLGFAKELANYGEYSGAPTEEETYQYAKTVLDLMTRGKKRADGKVLLIGGGIANFTDVAKTFTGIIRALEEFKPRLIAHKAEIYVRRGGPNYQEGLARMRKVGETLGVPIHVYGPETHMTKIVSMALKGGK